jgi:hypothetical protein
MQILTSSRLYFESVSRQLLSAGERRWEQVSQNYSRSEELGGDGTFVFIGEVISRLSRRGQAGMLLCNLQYLCTKCMDIFK